MSEKDGSRLRSRLRLAALLAGLPIALASTTGLIHTPPAAATTAAHAGPVLDLSGAILVGKGDHGGDKSSHGGDRSSHDSGGDRSSHDSRGDRSSHDSGGDRSSHDSRGDRSSHDSGGDRHGDSRDRHEGGGDHNGAECHNCGIDNGDHRSDDHRGDDHSGDHHGGGEKGGCSPSRESLLEALVDGLCTGAETLERGLTGAK